MVLMTPRKRYTVMEEVKIHQNVLETLSLNVMTIMIFPCQPLKKIYLCQ